MKDIKIEYKKLDEIKPYENNPRNNDEGVDKLVNSIKEFGFKVPIVIDKDGVIVAGHTRYKASQKLGLEKVPVIIADDLNEKQIKAFRLADNKVAELSGWDTNKLSEELKELDIDMDMTDFGFSNFEITVYTDDELPDDYDKDLIEEYTRDDDELLARKRVIITYLDEDSDFMKTMLKEKDDLKVVYSLEEIKDRYE